MPQSRTAFLCEVALKVWDKLIFERIPDLLAWESTANMIGGLLAAEEVGDDIRLLGSDYIADQLAPHFFALAKIMVQVRHRMITQEEAIAAGDAQFALAAKAVAEMNVVLQQKRKEV